MPDALFWTVVGVAVSAAGFSMVFATFWMNMQRQITEAKTEAGAAGLRGVQANLKIDTLQSGLSDFKVYAQKEFVNHGDLNTLVDRHEAQFENLREDLKGITKRLDRLLETRLPSVVHHS
jgi:hypothetical protein